MKSRHKKIKMILTFLFLMTMIGTNASIIKTEKKNFDINPAPSSGPFDFLYKWGSSGSNPGQFSDLYGIAINSTGQVYAADGANQRVQVFSKNGVFLYSIDTSAVGDGNPSGIAVNSTGYVFVGFRVGYKGVRIYSPDGDFIRILGPPGSGDGEFGGPMGMVFNSTDHLFVSDSDNDRIQVFSPNGTFIREFGTSGSGDGQLIDPRGIGINSSGYIFVAENNNNRVGIFDPMGNFHGYLGTSGYTGGTSDDKYNSPEGLSVNGSDYVFICDGYNRRVKIYTPNGTFHSIFGEYGSNDGEFEKNDGIAFTPSGRFFISDEARADIQVFGNTVPVISDVKISPENATTTDVLTLNYTYSDLDLDQETITEILWYKNGTVQSAFNDSLTIPSYFTNKSDQWYATVHSFDGYEFGDVQISNVININNTPPISQNLTLLPNNPKTDLNLSLSYDYYDVNGDLENNSKIRWYKNDSMQSAFNDSLSIHADFTNKSDEWYATVQPFDGDNFGNLITSNTVSINNSIPIIENHTISPGSPKINQQLNLLYDYYDLDADLENNTQIRWYKNNTLQTNFNDSLSVPAVFTNKSDQWYATVLPHDGESYGIIYTTSTRTILEVHSKVYIDGNAALDAFCAGNGTDGTISNPHEIKDYIIDAEGTESGIEIRNIDKFLIIENCRIYGSGSGSPYAGITLYQSMNVNITSNYLYDNYVGIYLVSADENTIYKNSIYSNDGRGIVFSGAHNNSIVDNLVTDNHYNIDVQGSRYNLFSENDVSSSEYGFYLDGSNYNILIENTVYNHKYRGIYLHISKFNNISNNYLHSNNYSGVYIDNTSDNNTVASNTIEYNKWHGIRIRISQNNEVSNNNISFNENHGIFLDNFVLNSVIENNEVFNNSYSGIMLDEADYNFLLRNVIYNNVDDGIRVGVSDYNFIYGNEVNFNGLTGIWISSSSIKNDVWSNLIGGNNAVIAEDNGADNDWDDGVSGNYWSDYLSKHSSASDIGGIWDTAYNVLGSSNSLDRFPLVNIPMLDDINPVANFTLNITHVAINQTIQFTDLSTGGNVPLTYQWNFGDGPSNSSEINPIHNYSAAGIYDVILGVIDKDGDYSQFGPISITVDEDFFPIANFSANTTFIFEGEFIQFTNLTTGGNLPLDFEWDFGDGSSNSTEINPIHQFISSGNYTVTLTVSDFNGDLSSYSISNFTVLNDTIPVINFTSNATQIIAGQFIEFSDFTTEGNPPLNYQWNFGDGSSNSTETDPIHQYLIAGSYNVTLTVSDIQGDSSVRILYNLSVLEDLLPIANFTVSSNITIAGEVVDFTNLVTGGNLPLVYEWDFGDGGSNSSLINPNHTYTSAGMYSVVLTVTDMNGDISIFNEINITVLEDLFPTANFSANLTQILQGQSIEFTDLTTGGNLPLNFSWNFGDGFNSSDQNPIHQFNTPGNFNVSLNVTDLDGDMSFFNMTNISVYVDTIPIPDFIVNSTNVIQGQYVLFTDLTTAGNLPLIYQWNFGDGSSNSTEINPIHQYLIPGSFQVVLSVNDSDGDFAVYSNLTMITVNEDVFPLANFTLDINLIVEGQFVQFYNFSTKGNGLLNYSWDFGDSYYSYDTNPIHTYNTPGVFNVTLAVFDIDGDYSNYTYESITVQTESFPIADFTANSTQIVAGQTISFSDTTIGGNQPLVYYWDFGDGTYSSDQNPNHTYTIEGIYSITLQITDLNEDTSNKSINDVIVLEDLLPVASIYIRTADLIVDAMILFEASEPGGNNPLTCLWDFGDNFTSQSQTPGHVFNDTGSFLITLSITDVDGDVSETSMLITISDRSPEPSDPGPNLIPLIVGLTIGISAVTAITVVGFLYFRQKRRSNLSSPGHRTGPIAQENIAKLSELFANERSINVNKIAETLDISRNELFEFLVEHGESIGEIKIKGNELIISDEIDIGGFADLLDKQFEEWKNNEKVKDGKT